MKLTAALFIMLRNIHKSKKQKQKRIVKSIMEYPQWEAEDMPMQEEKVAEW